MSEKHFTDFVTEWTDCGTLSNSQGAAADSCHDWEKEVAQHLLARQGVTFQRLVVRRIACDTVCIEGSMFCEEEFDVEDYLKCLPEVERVLNRLTIIPRPSCGEETLCGEETVVDW